MARPTMNELMGSSGNKAADKDLDLDDLKEILGEKCPKIEFTPVGRMRLTAALRVRFGDQYRNLPGIDGILKEFDKESAFNVKMQEMKMIKAKGKK